MILPSEGDAFVEISEILAGAEPPAWATGSVLVRTDAAAVMARRWIYAEPVVGGCRRRLVAGGQVKRVDITSTKPEGAISNRCLPGRDPDYAGESSDILLYPIDWCSAAPFCDGFNAAWLGRSLAELAHLVTIFGCTLKGATDVLTFARALLDTHHRAETIILVEPDLLGVLPDVPVAALRR